MGITEILYLLLAVYIVVIIMCTAFSYMEVNGLTPSGWVKVIFWPITISIFLLAVLLWILIWVPRQLFNGICICFAEIKDFFINIFRDATGKRSSHKS